MRRSLIVAVVVLVACSKPDTPAADTAAPAAAPAQMELRSADVAGTWDARVMPLDRDTVVATYTWNLADTGAGTSIVFPSGLKVVATKRQMNGDSMIFETGGFRSQVRKGQDVASTRAVMRMQNGELTGTMIGRYTNGDSVSYHIMATKRP